MVVQKSKRRRYSLQPTGIRYLFRLNETFYFRYTTPQSHIRLSKRIPKQVKISLQTVSKSMAVSRLGALWSILEQMPLASSINHLEMLYAQLKSSTLHETKKQVAFALEQPPSCMSLKDAWVLYLQGKNWKEKRRKNVEQMFLNILLFLGDKPVDAYARNDIEQALSSIAKLPQRNRKPYSSMSLEDTVGLDIPLDLRISDKTVKEHLKIMVGLFSEYLVKELKVLPVSPTDGVTYKTSAKRFGSFTDTEVCEILSGAKNKPVWFYWFAMLGAYTGARRSEIARLTKADFGICNDSKRAYFRITQGKTASSIRIVPLSHELVEAGFLDYLESVDQEQLFDTAYRNPNRVTDLFGSLITSATDVYGDRLVFHSLRHTFITKARMEGLSTSLVQQYVGHSITGGGITDRYTHRYTVQTLASVCDAIHYPLKLYESGKSLL